MSQQVKVLNVAIVGPAFDLAAPTAMSPYFELLIDHVRKTGGLVSQFSTSDEKEIDSFAQALENNHPTSITLVISFFNHRHLTTANYAEGQLAERMLANRLKLNRHDLRQVEAIHLEHIYAAIYQLLLPPVPPVMNNGGSFQANFPWNFNHQSFGNSPPPPFNQQHVFGRPLDHFTRSENLKQTHGFRAPGSYPNDMLASETFYFYPADDEAMMELVSYFNPMRPNLDQFRSVDNLYRAIVVFKPGSTTEQLPSILPPISNRVKDTHIVILSARNMPGNEMAPALAAKDATVKELREKGKLCHVLDVETLDEFILKLNATERQLASAITSGPDRNTY